MSNPFQQVKTYADNNEFAFVCPIFGAETKIRACLALREEVWAGRGHEKRKGCQACMQSSKCPIVAIMAEIQHRDTDPYFSATPKVGRLHSRHLERILPITVQQRHIDNGGVNSREAELIATANDRIRSALGRTKSDGDENHSALDLDDTPVVTMSRRRVVAKPATSRPPVNSAAVTGDMSAAINEAVNA